VSRLEGIEGEKESKGEGGQAKELSAFDTQEGLKKRDREESRELSSIVELEGLLRGGGMISKQRKGEEHEA